jgi:hypothetical protein
MTSSTRSPLAVCHFRVGAAVQRPFQRTDRRDDRGVDIGERSRSDARRKRRGIELVVGVQRERDVEGANRRRIRPLAGQHVEEVRGVAHCRVRRDWSSASLQPSPRGNDRADLRRESDGRAILRRR